MMIIIAGAVAIIITIAFTVKLTIVIAKQNKGKICNTVDLPFFHHDGNGSKQQRRRPHEATTVIMIAVSLFATRIALMLGSDEGM